MKYTCIIALLLIFNAHSMAQSTHIQIKTDMGSFTIALYDSTPLHRNNFIKLCRDEFYNKILFHRVIENFVAQAGDPDSKSASDTAGLGEGDLKYKIGAEFVTTYFHKRGAVGMARDNNPGKLSSACQFYVVTGRMGHDSLYQKAFKRTGIEVPTWKRKVYESIGGIPFLDNLYTVFGEVTEGMDVIDQITKVKTDKRDRPLHNIRILKTTILSSEKK